VKPGFSLIFLAALSVAPAAGATLSVEGTVSPAWVERDVRIRVATVTAGIRGTDLWGKSDDQRDLVCLLEGRISVSHAQTGEITMSEPLAFFIAPRQQPPLPVGKVTAAQMRQWAAETELDTVAGGARRGGRFRVEVSTAPDQQSALRDYDAVRRAGYPAVIQPVKSATAVEYRVRIVNLLSERDAQAMAEKVKALGLANATVGK